jgi:small GTP-binding protein
MALSKRDEFKSDIFYDFLLKIVLVGDSAVGKSGMLIQYTRQEFYPNYHLTIGVEFETKMVTKNGKIYKLQIWDTAGQEAFRSITQSYYRGAAGCILMYDVSNRDTFDSIQRWHDDVKMRCESEVIMILVGNKIDLDKRREVSIEEGQQLAEKLGVKFFETSVMQPININECFLHIIDRYSETYAVNSKQIVAPPNVTLEDNENKKKCSC